MSRDELNVINSATIAKDLFVYLWCEANSAPQEIPRSPGKVYGDWNWEEIQDILGQKSQTIRRKLLSYYHNVSDISEEEKVRYLKLIAREIQESPSTVHGYYSRHHRNRNSYPYCGYWLEKYKEEVNGEAKDLWKISESKGGKSLHNEIESVELAEEYAEKRSSNECMDRAKKINSFDIETLSDEKIKEIRDSIKVSTYLTDEFWDAVIRGDKPIIEVPNHARASRFHEGTKKELLKMAHDGEQRPFYSKSGLLIDKRLNNPDMYFSPKEENELCDDIRLSSCLLRLTRVSSELYDSDFDMRVRALAPNWFDMEGKNE